MSASTSQSQQINRTIYLADNGIRLMRPDYFTPEVRQFHHCERSFFLNLLRSTRYNLIIEVGCSHYRLIGVKSHDADYLGIDINPPRARRSETRDGAVIRCDANKFFRKTRLIDEIVKRYDGNILCILPFNFLGTMDAPLEFLTIVCQAPFDLALSLFSTSKMATAARVRYYDLCGIEVKSVARTNDYVRLNCSNGFQAFAFDPGFLRTRIRSYGFRLDGAEHHEICNFLHFSKERI